jgi:cobalt/nickel transport system permease protein
VSSAHRPERAAARLRSPVSSLAPGPKVVGLVAFLVVVAVTPASAAWALAVDGAVALAVATLALVDWRAVAGRLTLDLPLAVLALTYALAGRAPHVEVAGLSLSQPGLRAGLAILARATIGIVAVSAVAASTSVPEIVDGLRRLGAPAWFRQMVAVTARQLQVLRADLARLRLAVAVRTGSGRRTLALASGARSLGSLFVRSTERAERLRLAADLRGAGPGAEAQPGLALAAPTAAPTPRMWAAALLPALAALAARGVLG